MERSEGKMSEHYRDRSRNNVNNIILTIPFILASLSLNSLVTFTPLMFTR